MPYSLKDIGDRLAALEALGLSNRVAVLEASQSGVGGSGEFAGFAVTSPWSYKEDPIIFFNTSQETTLQTFPVRYLFVSPAYTLYIKRDGGSWYSFVGRLTPYNSGAAIDALGSSSGSYGINITYYSTKN